MNMYIPRGETKLRGKPDPGVDELVPVPLRLLRIDDLVDSSVQEVIVVLLLIIFITNSIITTSMYYY